jgi:hypothetical protein
VGPLGGIVVALVFLALVGWNVVRLAEGETTVEALACVDPTDPCNWSSYRVANDSNAPVVLRECEHRCESGDRRLDPILVAPGTLSSSDRVRAAVGARDWWEAQTVSGHQLVASSSMDIRASMTGTPFVSRWLADVVERLIRR